MLLGVTLSRCVSVSAELRISTARCISLGGEGNALYPVFSSFFCYYFTKYTHGVYLYASCMCSVSDH